MLQFVAPLVGAWIEILNCVFFFLILIVAPLVGAWIEIVAVVPVLPVLVGRSPRGSVD